MPSLPLVFLVDDDNISNFLHTEVLRHLDPAVEVRTALDGQQALDLLRTHGQSPLPRRPALVLLDLNMPVLDGFELLETYQHLPAAEREGVVIVMLTSSIYSHDLARLQSLPAAGFLSKPLTEEHVVQVLADHFPPDTAAQ